METTVLEHEVMDFQVEKLLVNALVALSPMLAILICGN